VPQHRQIVDKITNTVLPARTVGILTAIVSDVTVDPVRSYQILA